MRRTGTVAVATEALPNTASAGFRQQRIDPENDIESQVYEAWRVYTVEVLGRTEAFARNAAMRSISLVRGTSIVEACRRHGINLEGARAIDVGSGLGDVAIALAQAGAEVTAVEPCDAWREIAKRRSEQLGLDIRHLSTDAHDLPFDSETFDVLVNLQVLEHVKHPKQAIGELSRVLKRGGFFSISCENYLAFREQHYGIAWLPLMPKWLGSLYLRARGRKPQFLVDHITYTYWPSLARWFLSSGLHDESWIEDLDRLKISSLTRRERLVAALAKKLQMDAHALLIVSKNLRRLFRPGFRVMGFKRDAAAG